MTKEQYRVWRFYNKFGLPFRKTLGWPNKKSEQLAIKHIEEEAKELREAIERRDIIEVADALADLLYVTYGAALRFGVDLEPVFDEVHTSNMRKVWPAGTPHEKMYNEDGKYLKPPEWKPPDIRRVLREQNHSGEMTL